MLSTGRSSLSMSTVGIIAGVVFFILSILILTSSIIALRCTHARKQPRMMKPTEDVVYDEICAVGMNPLSTQLALKENSAYTTNEVAKQYYEDEYVTMT